MRNNRMYIGTYSNESIQKMVEKYLDENKPQCHECLERIKQHSITYFFAENEQKAHKTAKSMGLKNYAPVGTSVTIINE